VSALSLIALGLAALCTLFALLYLVARRLDNYGLVDIAWSYAFGALAAFYSLCGPGWPVRRALIAAHSAALPPPATITSYCREGSKAAGASP